jgi:hypothetical protein
MISINVPGIGKILQVSLLNFIYLDILQTDLWLFPILFPTATEVDNDDDDKALNIYFEENGFTSLSLIKNLGSTFVYLFVYCMVLGVIGIMGEVGTRIPR